MFFPRVQGEHERVSADLQLHGSGLLFQLQHAEIYMRGCIHIYVYICNGGGRRGGGVWGQVCDGKVKKKK